MEETTTGSKIVRGNALQASLEGFFAGLRSNLKTVNGESLFGTGDISASGGDIDTSRIPVLNDEGVVQEHNVPASVYDVVTFSGFHDDSETLEIVSGGIVSRPGATVFYKGHFVRTVVTVHGQPPTQAMSNWLVRSGGASIAMGERYGTPTGSGITPVENKIYIDTSSMTAYIWDGSNGLKAICSGGGSGTGLTPWQQKYLQELEDKEFASKFSVSVSVNPSSKEMDGTATSVKITVRTTFDGKPVDATVSDTSGLELNYLSVSTGVYEAVHEIAAPCVDETGKMSRSFGVSASYTPEGGSGLTKSASASVQLYAQCRIMQTDSTEAPDGMEIATATNRRRNITGTYDIAVEPGKYVWLCVPSGIGSISKITSSGFAVPVEPPVEIKVPCGTATVRYRCWRISGAPQSSPMSVVVS